MLREKIHIVIPIFAALVVSIISFFNGNDLYFNAIMTIIAIVVFYFVGLLVKYYLDNYVFAKPKPDDTEKKETGNEK